MVAEAKSVPPSPAPESERNDVGLDDEASMSPDSRDGVVWTEREASPEDDDIDGVDVFSREVERSWGAAVSRRASAFEGEDSSCVERMTVILSYSRASGTRARDERCAEERWVMSSSRERSCAWEDTPVNSNAPNNALTHTGMLTSDDI